MVMKKGLCLDCCGREIYLPTQDKIKLPENDGIYYLVLQYKETGIELSKIIVAVTILMLPMISNANDELFPPAEYIHSKIQQNDILFIGTPHQKPRILKFKYQYDIAILPADCFELVDGVIVY